jgi:WD40 repeat protein
MSSLQLLAKQNNTKIDPITAIAFSPNGSQLSYGCRSIALGMDKLRFMDLSQCNQEKSRYSKWRICQLLSANEEAALVTEYAQLEAAATHLVYSENGKYLAIATTENKIHIWRAQYNGKFEEYAQLSDHTTNTISAIRFTTTSAAAIGYETRVLLLAVYNDGQHYHLHTYDILTTQETRMPVTVAQSQGTSMHDVTSSGSMECVVSATLKASTVNVVTPLRSVSAAVQRLYILLDEPNYHDAVELFKQHPAVAFQPIMKHGFPNCSLIEYALMNNNAEELLCLLDPSKPVLDGTYLNISTLLFMCMKLW